MNSSAGNRFFEKKRQYVALHKQQGLLIRMLRPFRRLVRSVWRMINPPVMPRRSLRPTVSQVTESVISENVIMEVYWLEFNNQAGPAASIYIFNDEVMRFDCFGGKNGHFHINMLQSKLFPGGGSARIYLSMEDVGGQIREAGFWLRHNLAYSITTNRNSEIRSISVAPETLDAAAEKMMQIMFALVEQNAAPVGK